MHPLADDLSNLKDLEIESKIQELSRKYWMTNNPNIQNQISLFLDLYRSELANRRAKLWQEQTGKRNENLDKLINVS